MACEQWPQIFRNKTSLISYFSFFFEEEKVVGKVLFHVIFYIKKYIYSDFLKVFASMVKVIWSAFEYIEQTYYY